MNRNVFNWIEIYVSDMSRAIKFYSDVFKYEMNEMQVPEGMNIKMCSFPSNQDAPGAAGALVQMEGFTPGGNGVIPYFSCEDCSAEQGRVEAAGGKIMKPKFPIGEYGFIAIITDSEGNAIGLHSMK